MRPRDHDEVSGSVRFHYARPAAWFHEERLSHKVAKPQSDAARSITMHDESVRATAANDLVPGHSPNILRRPRAPESLRLRAFVWKKPSPGELRLSRVKGRRDGRGKRGRGAGTRADVGRDGLGAAMDRVQIPPRLQPQRERGRKGVAGADRVRDLDRIARKVRHLAFRKEQAARRAARKRNQVEIVSGGELAQRRRAVVADAKQFRDDRQLDVVDL